MKLGVLSSQQFNVSFSKLMESKDTPVRTRFKLRAVSKQVKEEQEKYEQIKNEIIKKYAKKDEDGNIIFIDNDKVTFEQEIIPSLNKEMADLHNIEVEMDSISVGDLGDAVEELSANDFTILEFIEE